MCSLSICLWIGFADEAAGDVDGAEAAADGGANAKPEFHGVRGVAVHSLGGNGTLVGAMGVVLFHVIFEEKAEAEHDGGEDDQGEEFRPAQPCGVARGIRIGGLVRVECGFDDCGLDYVQQIVFFVFHPLEF